MITQELMLQDGESRRRFSTTLFLQNIDIEAGLVKYYSQIEQTSANLQTKSVETILEMNIRI